MRDDSMTAREVIERLDLVPLPGEGGYFRQTWVSADRLEAGTLGPRYPRGKAAGTAIYYLVTDAADGFSALHRLPTDEIFHFYLGDPVEQLLLAPDGTSDVVVLGPDLRGGQRVQHVVPAGTWPGTRVRPAPGAGRRPATVRWALLGTTMAPGFDPDDSGSVAAPRLERAYPGRRGSIRSLTVAD